MLKRIDWENECKKRKKKERKKERKRGRKKEIEAEEKIKGLF